MSLVFSDTTEKSGIIQHIEDYCGFNDGDISGNPTRLKKFTAAVNSAMDEVWGIALPASGTWQFDDSNHSDYPIMMTDLVAGQRDYPFTVDGSGNIVLDIFKVFVKGTDGVYREIKAVDVEQTPTPPDGSLKGFTNGLDEQGTPTKYDKMANSIFLDRVPNYSSVKGLKIYINREASYFTSSDTTKRPGFYGLFHEYLAIRPSYFYFLRNKVFDLADRYKKEMLEMEREIGKHYAGRIKDEPKRLIPGRQNNK